MKPYDAVLFISFGGPEKKEDILPFLEGIAARLPAGRQGRGIPRERLLEVAEHYEHLGGKSPINDITRRQARALEKELAAQGRALPVYIGQRHWHPFVEDTLRTMQADGVKRAVGFITAAHRCEASLERYVQAVAEARARIGADAPIIDYVDPWFDHPLFIEAIAARINEVLESESVGGSKGNTLATLSPSHPLTTAAWYFVAHSIPCSMATHSTYVADLTRTLQLVCERVGKTSAQLAYSSRSGRPTDPWLTPDINDVIETQARAGHTDIVFITIGFIADHVEVLFDQDVEARATAEKAGIRFHRTQTVGDHPLFIRMISEVIQTATPHGR